MPFPAPIPWTSSYHPPPPKPCISFTASILLSSYSPVLICQAQTSIILVPRNRSIHSTSSQHHPVTCSTWLIAPLPAGSPSWPRQHSPASHFGLYLLFTCCFEFWLRSGDPAASRSICITNISSFLPLPSSPSPSHLCPQHSLLFNQTFT